MSNLTDGTTQDEKVKMPDLSDILDKIDFDRKPISHTVTAKRGNFHVGKWGSLIIELVSYPHERDEILEEFGLTKYQFSELMGNSVFKAVYKDVESSIISLASNGGFQLSARRLAEQGQQVLEEILENGTNSERLKAIELIARLANLDPMVQAKLQKEQVAVNTGVQLVVNLSPDLPVPQAFQGNRNLVIDTKAEEVVDVE